MYISFSNFFYKLFCSNHFRIDFKELATFYLIDAKPLIWIFLQSFFNKLSKLWRRRNVLENFPIVLFDSTWESLVVGICWDSFPERRRLHVHHKESSTTSKNICFLTVVFWEHSQLSHLTIYVSVIDIFFILILVLLFIFYFLFSFV